MDPVSLSSLPVGTNRVFSDPLASAGPSGADGISAVGDGLGVSFSEVLSQSATGFADTVKKAEAVSISGIKGDVGAYEVATAVMEAEQQLRMATAVRDRIVQAFQEISRMQI